MQLAVWLMHCLPDLAGHIDSLSRDVPGTGSSVDHHVGDCRDGSLADHPVGGRVWICDGQVVDVLFDTGGAYPGLVCRAVLVAQRHDLAVARAPIGDALIEELARRTSVGKC